VCTVESSNPGPKQLVSNHLRVPGHGSLSSLSFYTFGIKVVILEAATSLVVGVMSVGAEVTITEVLVVMWDFDRSPSPKYPEPCMSLISFSPDPTLTNYTLDSLFSTRTHVGETPPFSPRFRLFMLCKGHLLPVLGDSNNPGFLRMHLNNVMCTTLTVDAEIYADEQQGKISTLKRSRSGHDAK
jgi:hypothetical protein